ncbi:MAG: lysine--tRNA ligase [Pyrinomonadaceae bacterium]
MSIPFIEENDQTQARREHLEALRALVGNVYPNKFARSNVAQNFSGEDTISDLANEHMIARIVNDDSFAEVLKSLARKTEAGEKPSAEELQTANEKLNKIQVRISGRIASPPRVMGKAAFVHLSDGVGRLQIYARKADVQAISNDTGAPVDGEGKGWELFGLLDHGDFIGVAGYLFVTRTGELSVHVEQMQFLAKALLPMPDKMHGINDPEIRQRQRYADLIAGSLKLEREEGELTPREVFQVRSKVVRELRRFLDDHGYIEVETPMLTPKATGALARPFKTHHNALDIDLYARIAPELYLKRLVVGGFEKVYELNRNFRNEGIDRTHNPEFTMLEFYSAYMDVNGMMDFCEEMLRATVFTALGHTHVRYGEHAIDFSQPFQRLSMKEAVEMFAPPEIAEAKLLELFEQHVEFKLIEPTFITDFPKVISPLSKASPSNPAVAERFEFFVGGGLECANGFSELNDPEEQYQRFKEQAEQREGGDEEAMVMDEDYIRALSYGMPPAAGIGIGIDRLVMLLANQHSIRDVILFPHMRPEPKSVEPTSE